VALLVTAACLRPKPVMEQASPTIQGTKFKTLATIAADDATPNIRMSAQVRQSLNDSGWVAIRRSGRWESQAAAILDICADGGIDGVLLIAFDRLELTDCQSQRPAYRIDASYERDVGLTEMTKRLMRYLRGQPIQRRRS
jgi:hypothetical protein